MADDGHEVQVQETALPGIGLRHDFVTGKGRRVGVVSHRTGRRDLVIYDPVDPDACSEVVTLSGDEADALAEFLGATRVSERLTALNEQVTSLVTEQLKLEPGSRFDGQSLGDTEARRRTGASIVAVLRDGEALPSPRPDFALRGGDTLIVVGTSDGVAGVADILAS